MTDMPEQPPPPVRPNVDSEPMREVLAERTITSSVLTHLLGWVVAFSVGGLMMALVFLGAHLATSEAGESERISVEQEMSGRMIYAAGPGGMQVDSSLLVPQLSQLNDGSLTSRLAYAILTSELNTPAEGIQELDSIHEEKASGTLSLSPEQETLLEDVSLLLFAAASGEQADELPEERAESLRLSLGFFAELLIARASGDQNALDGLATSAVRGMLTLIVTAIWFLSFFIGGLAAIFTLVMFALYGKLETRFVLNNETGSVYIETFAIWITMFVLLQFVMEALSVILQETSLAIYMGPEFSLVMSLILMFVSLSALVWPRIRGISSKRLLEDIGLARVNVLREILPGFVTYAIGLPLLVGGLLLSIIVGMILNAVFGEQPAPSHPIQGLIGDGGWMTIVLVYLVACVGAPITEEIMFRGVLYRYLREVSRAWTMVVSLGFSMIISSVLFAAIHPQGLTFIPVLGALAVAFCIGREWRGSLVAPMIAHGVSNGAVMTMSVFLFG